MPVAFDPFTIAADLATCVAEALQDEGRGEFAWGEDTKVCVRPGGEVPWDSCCENGGQAWIALKNGYPTTSFPIPDTNSDETSCTSGLITLGVNFEIGVLRCVDFDMGDCEKSESSAGKLIDDLAAVFKALNCCFAAATDDCDRGWRMNGFEMLGPQGGCGGSKIDIVVHTNYPCCPPPEEITP